MVELALVAVTVRSVPNLVYVNSTETMSLRPRPASSTRIEVLTFTPSRAKVTKRIVGDNANAGIDGEAVAGVVVAGVVVAGASVLGAVSVSGADSSSNPSVAGVASGLAGAPVEGVAVAGVADSTSVVTLEVVSGDSTMSADSD